MCVRRGCVYLSVRQLTFCHSLALADRMPSTPLTPFLTLLKPKKLAIITIMELMRLQGTGGVSEGMKTARALISVGQAVELEYNAEARRARMHARYTMSEAAKDTPGLQGVKERRDAAREEEKFSLPWSPTWTQAMRVRIGSVLVDALMDTATVTRSIPDPNTGET